MTESTARAALFELQSSTSPCYTWAVPQKPVTVRIPFPVIDRLEHEAVESFRSLSSRGSEIGGILFGTVVPGEVSKVSIEDYELIACDYSRGPLYRLADADMTRFDRAILQHGAAGSLSAVGIFRSHTRKGLSLDAEDLAFFDSRFREAHNIALLIRPFATKASAAGLFIREAGVVNGEASYLEFPFRSSLLSSQGAAAETPESRPAPSATNTPAAAPPAPRSPARGQIVPMPSRRETSPASASVVAEPVIPVKAEPEPVVTAQVAAPPVSTPAPTFAPPAPPPVEEKVTKPQIEVKETRPVIEEKVAKAAPPVEVAKPKVEVKAAPPAVEEKPVKPAEDRSFRPKVEDKAPKTPPVEDRITLPKVEEKTVKPVVEEKPAKAKGDDYFAKPAVEERPVKTRTDERAAAPVVEAKAAKAKADDFFAKPAVEEKVTKPAVEEKVTKPTVEEKVTKPTGEQRLAKPSMEDYFGKPTPVEEPAKPKVDDFFAKSKPVDDKDTYSSSPSFAAAAVLEATEEEPARGRSKMLWIGLGAGVLVLLLIAFLVYPPLLHRGRPSGAPAQDSSQLSLRVERTAGEILLTWNRDSDAIRSATHAVLYITDGDQHENVEMDLAQLRNGSISYSPASGDVVFKMEVTGKNDEKTASESVRVLRTRPSPLAGPETAPSPTQQQQQQVAAKPGTPLPGAPAAGTPAAANLPPVSAQQPPQTPEEAPGKAPERALKPFQAPTLSQRLHPVNSDLPDAPTMNRVETSSSSSVAGLNLGSVTAPVAPKAAAPAPTAAPPAAAPPKAAASGGQIQQAVLISKTNPEYPKLARETGAKGIVELVATIGADGRVKSVKVVKGPQMLQKAASDAVLQWRYKPTILNGVPVEAQTQVYVNFMGADR